MTLLDRRAAPLRRSGLRLVLALALAPACGDATLVEADAAGAPADAASDTASDACTAQSVTSDERDIDILFVMATSASMATIDGDAAQDSRWVAAANAVRTFVTGLSGRPFGAGITFYPFLLPDGDGGTPVESCSVSDYSVAEVPIAPLDPAGSQAASFEAALGARLLAGGNAMAAALEGGLKQAARAKARSGHVIQTVLVTDGAPDPCGGTAAAAAAVAGDAFQRDYLETYVLGVGPDATALDPIAAAGGTFRAYAASGNDDVAAALATLGASMRRCHFFFPMVLPPDGFSRIEMVVDAGKSGAEHLSRFTDGSRCAQNSGWFYNSPTSPAYAIFCPATCATLLERTDREVSAVLGCF